MLHLCNLCSLKVCRVEHREVCNLNSRVAVSKEVYLLKYNKLYKVYRKVEQEMSSNMSNGKEAMKANKIRKSATSHSGRNKQKRGSMDNGRSKTKNVKFEKRTDMSDMEF